MKDDAPDWLRALHDGEALDTPVGWNLAGMLQGWAQWPDAMDFFDPASPNHAWKRLETALYAELWGDVFDGGPHRILDAACGSGRMLVPLAQAGHEVVGIDACRPSLDAAARHLGDTPAELIWGDVRGFDAPPFDRILALELLCYLPDMQAAVDRLTSLLKPGGILILTVEAWPGAVFADPTGLTAEALPDVVRTRTIRQPGERWVQTSDRADLGAILRNAGLEVVSVDGTHYLPDGPLGGALELDRLGEEGYTEAVLAAERAARDDPAMGAAPRAWLAIATRTR